MLGPLGAIITRPMLDGILIVVAVAMTVVALLVLGIWRVDRRPVIDVTPARRPDTASPPKAANENAPQQ